MTDIKISNSSIWPIDRTLSGPTTLGLSRPRSNGNEEGLHIPQNSKTGASPSNDFASYPGHWLGVSYPSAEMQSMYSTVPANWAGTIMIKVTANIDRYTIIKLQNSMETSFFL